MRPIEEAGQLGLGVLAREEEIVKSLGLKYVNLPVPRNGPYSLELCENVSETLTDLLKNSKPVVVHCRTGRRAEEIMKQAADAGLMENPFTQICWRVGKEIEHSVGDRTRIVRVDENVYISGQIHADSLQNIKDLGVKSVINLREKGEPGFEDLSFELSKMGIECVHDPLDYDLRADTDMDQVLAVLDKCKKPCLVFCQVGLRAAAVGVAFSTTRKKGADAVKGVIDMNDVLETTYMNLLDDLDESHPGTTVKSFVAGYIASKLSNCSKRPGHSKISDDLYITGQLTEEELKDFAKKGVKSILNMRPIEEAGQLGLGVLAREEEIVKSLGLKYVNLPVPRNGPYSLELCENVSETLTDLLKNSKPVVVHCRTGRRAEAIIKQADPHFLEEEHSESKDDALMWKSTATLSSSCLMGLCFGAAMDLGKVTLPLMIREQFLFRRFLMLKMFLGAAASSALFLTIASKLAPKRFQHVQEIFMKPLAAKTVAAVSLGAFTLGSGMALSGSCPGMVLVQVGSGVPNSLWTLAGGMTAAALYGILQPRLIPLYCTKSKGKIEEQTVMSQINVPYARLASSLSLFLFGVICLVEIYSPWTSSSELPAWAKPWVNTLPPHLMGVIIGSLQLPAVFMVADTLGSSQAYMTLTSQPLGLSGYLQQKLVHWNGYRMGLDNWWQATYLLSAISGAYLSSSLTNTRGLAQGVPVIQAFVGGFLSIFGSRFASGCTSGHGLSGMALMVTKSVIAVPAMFAGGIFTGVVFQTLNAQGYTGFLKA